MTVSMYEVAIRQALEQPDDMTGLANRIHHSRVAARAAETPGRRHFARTQHRAAVQAFDRMVLAQRARSRSVVIALATTYASAVLMVVVAVGVFAMVTLW